MTSGGDDDRLLLIPGPTPVHQRILNALARPTIAHTSAELGATMRAALAGLSDIADNHGGRMFVIAGSGTLAQEMAIVNLMEALDTLLVASNGFFASRLDEIARHHGLTSVLVEAKPGTALTPDELDRAITQTGATVVAFTHVETSTGVMAPLSECMEVISAHGALAIVDGVAGFAGVPEPMEALGIDVLLTGAQKALGVPPGLAIVAVSEAAWQRVKSRSTPVPAYYASLVRWAPIMEEPEKYFSTHPVNMIRALAVAVELVLEEGLDSRYQRHERLADQFRAGLQDLGFEVFTDPRYLAPTLSAVRTPNTVRSSEFRKRLQQNGVVAAAGLGDPDDRIVRFGHMGNVTESELIMALDAVRRSLSMDE